MQVFYVAVPGHPVRGLEVVYQLVGGPRFCCQEMARHWGVMIGFGVRDRPKSSSKEVNIWTRIPQARGMFTWGLVEIRFCPFCGEAVEGCRRK